MAGTNKYNKSRNLMVLGKAVIMLLNIEYLPLFHLNYFGLLTVSFSDFKFKQSFQLPYFMRMKVPIGKISFTYKLTEKNIRVRNHNMAFSDSTLQH